MPSKPIVGHPADVGHCFRAGIRSNMTAHRHWQKAIPTYLTISFKYFVTISVPLLVVVVARSLLTSLGTHRFEISRLGIECSFILGGIFFLLAFLSAVVDDLLRNWKTQEPTVEWNPHLLWRNFIYVGAVMFFTAAFLAYQQGAWLTVVFLAFSIASLITCEKMFLNHLVMRCSRRERFVG